MEKTRERRNEQKKKEKKMSKSNKETIDVQTEFDQYQLHGYTCAFSSNGCIPLTRFYQDKQRNFFNFHQQVS